MVRKSVALLLALVSMSFIFAGCERDSAEKAGREIDRAGEKVRDGIEDLGDEIEDATDRK